MASFVIKNRQVKATVYGQQVRRRPETTERCQRVCQVMITNTLAEGTFLNLDFCELYEQGWG